MSETEFFKDYREFLSFQNDRYSKATLFQNDLVLVGLNCLLPDQEMEKHAHSDQDRFYMLVEGEGSVCVGNEHQKIKPGLVVWVPAGNAHFIKNTGKLNMVLFAGIISSKAE